MAHQQQNSKASNPRRPSYVTRLCEADVLLGRGSGPNSHVGNQRFRELVSLYRAAYSNATSVKEQDTIFVEIVARVYASEGKFLKKVCKLPKSTPSLKGEKDGCVYEIVTDTKVLCSKVKQTFRYLKAKEAGEVYHPAETPSHDDSKPSATPVRSSSASSNRLVPHPTTTTTTHPSMLGQVTTPAPNRPEKATDSSKDEQTQRDLYAEFSPSERKQHNQCCDFNRKRHVPSSRHEISNAHLRRALLSDILPLRQVPTRIPSSSFIATPAVSKTTQLCSSFRNPPKRHALESKRRDDIVSSADSAMKQILVSLASDNKPFREWSNEGARPSISLPSPSFDDTRPLTASFCGGKALQDCSVPPATCSSANRCNPKEGLSSSLKTLQALAIPMIAKKFGNAFNRSSRNGRSSSSLFSEASAASRRTWSFAATATSTELVGSNHTEPGVQPLPIGSSAEVASRADNLGSGTAANSLHNTSTRGDKNTGDACARPQNHRFKRRSGSKTPSFGSPEERAKRRKRRSEAEELAIVQDVLAQAIQKKKKHSPSNKEEKQAHGHEDS